MVLPVGYIATLTNSAGGRFTVSADGIVRPVAGTLDFETSTSHSLTMRVTHTASGAFRDKTFTIALSDIDEVAPTLSNATGAATGQTTATLSVSTTEGTGTLYFYVSNSASPPTVNNLKTGNLAIAATSKAVTSIGTQSANIASGLLASTSYYAHMLHIDAAGNESTRTTSNQFTTAAATVADTTAPTFTSANPSATFAEMVAIGGTLTATDAGSAVTFGKTGADQALVSLNTSTGVWSIPTTDFETKSSYSWTFTATDAALNSSSQNVAITISDIDEVANPFIFTDVTSATASTVYESNTITVAGLSAGVTVALAVSGGEYSKNGGAYTGSAGVVTNGDTLKVRHTSSVETSTSTNTILTFGGVSDTYTTTTAAPAGFTFANTEAADYVAAMTVQPNTARKTLIDALVGGLKADGVWPLLDRLIIAGHDEQAMRRDLRAPSKIASSVNSPPFVVDRGFSGDGVSAYLDLGEVFGSGGQYTLNSAHAGVWVVAQAGTNTSGPFGTAATAANNRVYYAAPASGNETFQMNDAASTDVLRASTGSRLGHRVLVRAGAAIKRGYINGALTADLTSAPTSLPGGNMSVLRRTNSYSSDRVAIYHCGAALTTTEAAAMHSRFSTYLTAIGAI